MNEEEFIAAWGEDFSAKAKDWEQDNYSVDIDDSPEDYVSSSAIVTGNIQSNFPAALEKSKILFPDLFIEYSAIQLAKSHWFAPQMEQITIHVEGSSKGVKLFKRGITQSLNHYNQELGDLPPIQWS